MSYKLGQLRKQSGTSYMTDLSKNLTTVYTNAAAATSTLTFPDTALQYTFEPKKYCYLNFSVARSSSSSQTITLILKNKDAASSTSSKTIMSDEYKQTLITYTIPAGTGSSNFELVISAGDTYNYLVFQLERTVEDYTSSSSRKASITINTFAEIKNVIPQNTLQKIGVQSEPGLLMCINGEEIRVGQSGIYEPIKSVPVTFIGFVIKNNEFFALDYQYIEEA